LATIVRSLDWLARFRIDWGPPGVRITLVDRNGDVHEGGWAVCRVFSRLPPTAWFVLPVLLLPGARRRGIAAGSAA
jgi:hypothetical protein